MMQFHLSILIYLSIYQIIQYSNVQAQHLQHQGMTKVFKNMRCWKLHFGNQIVYSILTSFYQRFVIF